MLSFIEIISYRKRPVIKPNKAIRRKKYGDSVELRINSNVTRDRNVSATEIEVKSLSNVLTCDKDIILFPW